MDMTSLNISLPRALKDYIEAQVAGGDYSTPSEYVRELIREERTRRAREKLETALMEGLNSGPAAEIRASDWTRKRKNLQERHKPARIAE